MDDKGEGEFKNLKWLVTLFIDGPQAPVYIFQHFKKLKQPVDVRH